MSARHCARLAALLLCAPALAVAAVKAVPAKRTDSMTVKQHGELIEIESPSGIGSGQVLRAGGKWPQTMSVRLKGFKALEHFRVTAGDTTMVCTLERPGGVTSQRVCRLGAQTVDAMSEAGEVFVVKLPQQLLDAHEAGLVVEWVDAWR